MQKLLAAIFLGGVLMTATTGQAQKLSADGAPQTFHVLTDQYFDDVFRFSPTFGTAAGLHQYDTQLEDYSATGVQKEIAALHGWEKKLLAIDPTALDAPAAADYQLLLNNVRSQLLSLETIRNWEKNPDNYSSGITGSVFGLMSRDYAPLNIRLRAVVERERQMPQVFVEARKNLKNPPRIFTEIALEQMDGNISFFQNDVPTAFAGATDKETQADFAKSNAAVIEALKSYQQWLKTDLLPRSNGEYKLGADTFKKKLLYDEMVDTPLDKLLDIAYADLHKNQAEFKRVAAEIDPTKTPEQELAELATIHPDPDKLLQSFRDGFDGEVAFIRSHHIITIPSDVRPTVIETPPFMRATTQAAEDSPGPFETHSKTAYFYVTLPEKDWTPEHVAEHMAAFNIGTLVSTGVHEIYPGHYVQFLYQPQLHSKVRKLITANTNVEGWAHYCEQMMLDAGYAAPNTMVAGRTITERESKLIRLGQLQDALLRNARFIVSIKLHTGDMTFDQAVDTFVKEGYQSHSIAEMEVKRGTSDAIYLYYTLGKLEIMKLRADVEKKQGAAFSLEKFHDDFMMQSFMPIKLVRKAMLGDDSPVL